MQDMGVISVVAAMTADLNSLETQRDACQALAVLAEKNDDNKVRPVCGKQALSGRVVSSGKLALPPTVAAFHSVVRRD